jgi:hypothetical protein
MANKTLHLSTVLDNLDEHWYVLREGVYLLHREDGPAVKYSNITYAQKEEWWYMGKKLHCKSQTEFEQLMKMKAFW